MTRTTTLASLLVLLLAPVAVAQEGAYTLQNQAGQRLGTLTIQAGEGGLLRMTAALANGRSRPALVQEAAGRLRFVGAPASGATTETSGLAGLGATAGAATAPTTRRTVDLVARTGGYTATIREGANVVATERLVRIRAALIVPAATTNTSHMNAFQAYANQVAAIYRARGYDPVHVFKGESWDVLIAKLEQAGKDGTPYERMVTIGHGGWDGPFLGWDQVSPSSNNETFQKFIAALGKGTTPAARIFASGCHTAGSNASERASKMNSLVWVHEVARAAKRSVGGPAGMTSTEYTRQHVLAVLEGEGTVRQEVVWATPTVTKRIRPGGSLSSAKVIQ